MLIPIRLHSPLLFHKIIKYCNFYTFELDQNTQKLKGKDFIHTPWIWAAVIWGQAPYSPQIGDPIPPSQPAVPG